jgi:hypothetical protein
MRGNTRKANVFQYKKQQAIRKLADSLPDSDPLRDHLRYSMEMNTPAVIGITAQPALHHRFERNSC